MSRKNQCTEKQESPIEIASRPQFSAAEVQSLLQEEYGLDGELRTLVSERDQNFRVTTDDGQCYVFKIANAPEPENVTDFQIQALLHIENAGCPIATPSIGVVRFAVRMMRMCKRIFSPGAARNTFLRISIR